MNRRTLTLVCWLAILMVPVVFGFNSGSFSLTRTFNKTSCLTNTALAVTATFVNSGTNSLRGFYYVDQVPSNLAVGTVAITLNGNNLTNYTFECGETGDVYTNSIPCRWLLELPPAFTETNPVLSQAWVQIIYSLTSPVAGTFSMQQFEWAGRFSGTTNAAFGYSEDLDQQSVCFYTTNVSPSLTGTLLANTFVIKLEGVPGTSYVIEASTNLFNWFPLVTNASPIQLTNPTGFSGRYYRGRLFQ